MSSNESGSAVLRRGMRLLWGGTSVVALETILLAMALLPVMAFALWQASWHIPAWQHIVLNSIAFVPLYLAFALSLMLYSALATRLLGWRTPEALEVRVNDFSWPVLDWGRYLMTIHVVRVFAGPAFRATPFWSFYMRLNGARIGHLVWVNSLSLMDHNLLEFGDGVVIGSDAHISGHIIERGVLKTARVRLGPGTLVGIGSVVGIGVHTGADAQVGPLSVVPKFTELESGAAYSGVPVHRLH